MQPHIRWSHMFLAVLLLTVFAASPTLGATTAFTVSTQASPSQVAPGARVSFTLAATNTSSAAVRADVNLTVVDPAGKQVYAKTWQRQKFAAGGSNTLTSSYTTAAAAAVGTYTARVKVQSSDGSAVYYDNANAASFQVVRPTPTNTPTPTSTPQPTDPPGTPTGTPTPGPTAVPGTSIYWGAAIYGVPWDMTPLVNFENSVGKPVSIVHFWSFWKQNGAMQAFYPSTLQTVRDHGSIPMITWPSEAMGGGVDQPDFQLADIINGNYDSYIRSWATGARDWGHPFFLRFDHEMNGNWFAWSETANGNKPGEYAQAWRHVHDIFTAVGARNVSWVWCPNVDYAGSPWPTYESLYPGDGYVDWTCMDSYNWGAAYPANGGWMSFSAMYKYAYDKMLALFPSKPIMIGETASSENGGSKADWLTDTYSVQLPGYFQKIKAIVYYNTNQDQMDWVIDSSTSSLNAFRAAIASPYYASNQFAGLNTTPIPPP